MLKKMMFGTALVVLICVPTAIASPATKIHRVEYERAYVKVSKQFGKRAPGRNIVKYGIRNRPATDFQVERSIQVLDRMLYPVDVRVQVTSSPAVEVTTSSTTTVTSVVSATPAPAPSSGLESCIIARESGGNSQAVNGPYAGEGQWSPSAWAQDGGTKYGASPLDATAAEQQQVLASEGSAGMEQQQGQFDGC